MQAIPAVQEQLRTVARLLREVHPLSAESQRLLGGLLDELSAALAQPAAPPDRLAHLTESTAQLVAAVHQQQEQHTVAGLRDSFARAVAGVESNHPTLAGLARQLLDALSNLGI